MKYLTCLLLVSLLVMPAQAGWDDPAAGGTGDYAWITSPAPGATVADLVYFNGTAGNNLTVAGGSSESNPNMEDPQGDTNDIIGLNPCFLGVPNPSCWTYPPNAPASDIGNIWITNDNGLQFQTMMRLHDGFLEVAPGTQTGPVYNAEFDHLATGVRYMLTAYKPAGLPWEAEIQVFEAALAGVGSLCGTPNTVTASYIPTGTDGILVWDVDYADLSALAPSPTCGGYIFGGTAQVGDLLDCFSGKVATRFGTGGAWFQTWAVTDSSDPAQCYQSYTLGPANVPQGPWVADIYVNEVLHGQATTNVAGVWTNYAIDFSNIGSQFCLYRVKVEYGTAFDEAVYRDGNCNTVIEEQDEESESVKIPERPEAKSSVADLTISDPMRAYRAWSLDGDLDGAPDRDDNCVFRHGGHGDLDGDGIGDGCDPDLDGDGTLNGMDNCAWIPNDQKDTDANGVGDACESDADGDGWSNALDNCPDVANPAQADLDQDGIGNVCDPDADGDGVHDAVDVFPLDVSEWADLDKDGIGDNTDPDADGDGFENFDEVAAGTDPMDKNSYPQDLSAGTHMVPAQAGIGGLASIGMALGLVVLGVVLFAILRRQS